MQRWLRPLIATARGLLLLLAALVLAPVQHLCAEDAVYQSGFLERTGEKFPWKLTVTHGNTLAAPKESIVVIYNHGSATDDNSEPVCNFLSRLFPVSDLVGHRVGGKTVHVYILCTNRLAGDFNNPEERDFPKAYACNYASEIDCRTAKYRELKRREAIVRTIAGFAAQGVPASQLFLAGHSCGGWQSLMVQAQYPEKIAGAIAYDPGCYGSAAWRARKPNYTRLMQNEIGVMRAAATLPALIFSNQSSACCAPESLNWLRGKPGIALVETPGAVKGRFLVGGEACSMVNLAGKKTTPISDGHRLNYAPCFMHYSKMILRFMEERISAAGPSAYIDRYNFLAGRNYR